MTTPRHNVLVMFLDADLRQQAFDELAAMGLRVDGVGDLASWQRRLAKDDYDLLVVEAGAVPPVTTPDGPPVIQVTGDGRLDTDDLVRRAREALGIEDEDAGDTDGEVLRDPPGCIHGDGD